MAQLDWADQPVRWLTAWAWLCRELDDAQALAVVVHVLQRLDVIDGGTPEEEALRVRLHLIRADVAWLRADVGACEHWSLFADQSAALLHAPSMKADAALLLCQLAHTRSDFPAREHWAGRAVAESEAGGDVQRLAFSKAMWARFHVFENWGTYLARWPGLLEAPLSDDPAVRALQAAQKASHLSRVSRHGEALKLLSQAMQDAERTGQLHLKVNACSNIGMNHASLNELSTALDWLERTRQELGERPWPATLGVVAMQLGEALRRLRHFELARTSLEQAQAHFACTPRSRSCDVATLYQLRLLLDLNQAPALLQLADATLSRADPAVPEDLAMDMMRLRSQALVELGRLDEAAVPLREAQALALSQGAVLPLANLWWAWSMLHERRYKVTHDPAHLHEALSGVQEALKATEQAADYLPPPRVWEDLARLLAMSGRHAEAYEAQQRATQALEQLSSDHLSQRLVAMQVRAQEALDRDQHAHLKALADAEAERARLADQTNLLLQRLVATGQALTTRLERHSVFEALSEQLPSMMDATGFSIYLHDPVSGTLRSEFDIEAGVRLPSLVVSCESSNSFVAKCWREQREQDMQWTDQDLRAHPGYHVPGEMQTLSALFGPLKVGERILGVMTVQSPREQAYSENDRLVFRTMCAYTAIALDNARAYRELRGAQQQLVAQEKLAALGGVVAGVAHELNTPLGNALLMASTLQTRAKEVEAEFEVGQLKRSVLQRFLADAIQASQHMVKALHGAGELVASFKRVAVDRTSEHRRPFPLAATTHDVVLTLGGLLRKHHHEVSVDMPDDIEIEAYPGAYTQVINNLVHNAVLHAFGERQGGQVRLSAERLPGDRVQIRCEDNGVGIAAEHLNRVFEPFFTTKLGQGGSGLGLSISYNIVQSLFGGEMSVSSVPGQGTTFVLQLPLVAPQTHEAG